MMTATTGRNWDNWLFTGEWLAGHGGRTRRQPPGETLAMLATWLTCG